MLVSFPSQNLSVAASGLVPCPAGCGARGTKCSPSSGRVCRAVLLPPATAWPHFRGLWWCWWGAEPWDQPEDIPCTQEQDPWAQHGAPHAHQGCRPLAPFTPGLLPSAQAYTAAGMCQQGGAQHGQQDTNPRCPQLPPPHCWSLNALAAPRGATCHGLGAPHAAPPASHRGPAGQRRGPRRAAAPNLCQAWAEPPPGLPHPAPAPTQQPWQPGLSPLQPRSQPRPARTAVHSCTAPSAEPQPPHMQRGHPRWGRMAGMCTVGSAQLELEQAPSSWSGAPAEVPQGRGHAQVEERAAGACAAGGVHSWGRAQLDPKHSWIPNTAGSQTRLDPMPTAGSCTQLAAASIPREFILGPVTFFAPLHSHFPAQPLLFPALSRSQHCSRSL